MRCGNSARGLSQVTLNLQAPDLQLPAQALLPHPHAAQTGATIQAALGLLPCMPLASHACARPATRLASNSHCTGCAAGRRAASFTSHLSQHVSLGHVLGRALGLAARMSSRCCARSSGRRKTSSTSSGASGTSHTCARPRFVQHGSLPRCTGRAAEPAGAVRPRAAWENLSHAESWQDTAPLQGLCCGILFPLSVLGGPTLRYVGSPRMLVASG